MIDTPQKPSDAARWKEEIAKRGEVRYIINTEPHADHVTCNYLFPGTVISHQKTREALEGSMMGVSMERLNLEFAKAIDPEGAPLLEDYQLRLPTITFTHRLYLYLGEHSFELTHLPGHTPGEIAVYLPSEKVVFASDSVFSRVQTWLHEALPFEWLESLQKIEALDVDLIVPGHGEVCGKDYLKEQKAFIEEWIEVVRKAIDQGLSQDEAAQRITFLERYPMDVGLDAIGPQVMQMNVRHLYDVLKAKG
jgi:glyoxylase-like metal-dependent hydrolase (beta-lactamase superfamily II)